MKIALRVRVPIATGAMPGGSSAAPARRSHARAAVSLGFAFAVAAQFALDLAVETVKPEWRDPEYGHRVKQLSAMARQQAQFRPDQPILIVLGSSRVMQGVSPAHLGLGLDLSPVLIYNFAHTGYGPVGEWLALQRLLESKLAPRYLLVELLPAHLTGACTTHPDTLTCADVGFIEPFHENPDRLRMDWLRSRIEPWFSLRSSLLSHFRPDLLPQAHRLDHTWKQMQVGGWMPYYPAELSEAVRSAARQRAQALHAVPLAEFHVDPFQDRAYRQVLNQCRDRGISVACFWMPESPAYRAWYSPQSRDRVNQYLAELRREYGVPVFNTSEWFDDEGAFWDGHHLLGPAAEEFSMRFGRECVAPWLGGHGHATHR
jgi:hypothetical protein